MSNVHNHRTLEPRELARARFYRHVCMSAVCAAGMLLVRTGTASLDARGDVPPRIERAHYVMGTVFTIEAYHHDVSGAERAIEEAFAEILRADELMSHYREESEISLLNREAARRPVRVQAELYALLKAAQRYTRDTGGAFDIATNSLTNSWQRAEERGTPLAASQLAQARSLLGAARLLLDDRNRTVRFDRTGVRVDLGGIAKGWAVDRAAALLRARGIQSALISAGTSTLYAIGAPPGANAWAIGIRDARDSADASNIESVEALQGMVRLRDMSLSTSAASERFFTIRGRKYAHIFDPRTGMPANSGLLSVTVVAPSATQSDALSTAIFVLGPREGASLLRNKGLGGLLINAGDTARKPQAEVIPHPGRGTIISAVAVDSTS